MDVVEKGVRIIFNVFDVLFVIFVLEFVVLLIYNFVFEFYGCCRRYVVGDIGLVVFF